MTQPFGSAHIQRESTHGAWRIVLFLLLGCIVWGGADVVGQTSADDQAGRVPLIEGGAGYIQNVSGGAPTLEPQVDPVLLVPFGRHFLLESRTDFTGFFQRENQDSGPFKGKVFKTVEFAQLDWLASSRVVVVAGRYLLPFGLYNERLQPIWIRNLQDAPLTATIGTRTTGAGDGLMLRGPALQQPSFTLNYSAYASVHSGINQIGAARAAGVDLSIFAPRPRFEIGTSLQRFLEDRHINSAAVYLSWQPPVSGVDLKAEWDRSYFGHGYWIETAWRPSSTQAPGLVRKVQVVGRMQEVFPSNGGGNGLPRLQTKRADFGFNYYFRDDLRFVSSYGRSFARAQNMNIWNVGLTYRFAIPLWFGGKK